MGEKARIELRLERQLDSRGLEALFFDHFLYFFRCAPEVDFLSIFDPNMIRKMHLAHKNTLLVTIALMNPKFTAFLAYYLETTPGNIRWRILKITHFVIISLGHGFLPITRYIYIYIYAPRHHDLYLTRNHHLHHPSSFPFLCENRVTLSCAATAFAALKTSR